MAFQETSCTESQVEKECEVKENDLLSLKPSLATEVNENLNGVYNDNYEVHFCNAEILKNADTEHINAFVVTNKESKCGGKKDEKGVCNGDVTHSRISDELDLLREVDITVQSVTIEKPFTNMKLPSVLSDEQSNLTVNGQCGVNPGIVAITEVKDLIHVFDQTTDNALSYGDTEERVENFNSLIDTHESLASANTSCAHDVNNCVNMFDNSLNLKKTEAPCELDVSIKNSSSCSLDSNQSIGISSINNNFKDEVENDEHNCLLHPAYVMAINETEMKEQKILELEGTIKRLRELLSLEISKSERISELEQTLSQREKELSIINKELEIDKQSFGIIKKEMENKCALLKKDIEMANRDKENMVMRYAVSEKELIDVKKEKETLMKKLKDTVKENESLLDRMKNLVNDKAKLSQLLDSKTTDLAATHKEIDKLKEEINARDIKIKWTQNKLKTEMEIHKECPAQLDKLMNKVQSLEEDLNAGKLESQNLKKQLDESEQNKILESQLKEEQAKLIMERYEHSEIETKYKSLQTKYQFMIEDNNSLSFQVQNLETERLELEKKLSSSREDTERLSNIVSDLQSKLVELDSLNSQLKQSEDKIDNLMSEMDRVRHQNEELLQDMSACRARETEMLSFTQKLTTKNVQLQSEFSTLESKATELEKKDEKSRIDLKELKKQLNEVQAELINEKTKREEETRLLARQIAERTKKGEAIEAELVDTKSHLTQSKLKHATIMKELQRELSLLRRKLDTIEASGPYSLSSSNSVSETHYIQACDVPREILVERILKLQAEAAKSAEKIEFLEDHTAQLLIEVQKQSRLLQSYMLREEAGALAPSFLDNHKAEVSKHGGIMASLYSSTQQDEGMSLELSLEINRKLQSVLEDTLLKNIMLKEKIVLLQHWPEDDVLTSKTFADSKPARASDDGLHQQENLDTLGDEIARLTGKK